MAIRLENEGYVICSKRFSESKNLLSVFTKDYGRVDGISPISKKNPIDIGSKVHMKWSAKLPHQLGFMEVHHLKTSVLFFNHVTPSCSYGHLLMLQSALALLSSTLVLHHPYSSLYDVFDTFVNGITFQNYVQFELSFLKELGFGLDLGRCAVTGDADNLFYLSPKSGCAVSKHAGYPYKEKLLLLPKLFQCDELKQYTAFDITQALQVLGYFIKKHLVHGDFPLPRQMLANHCTSLQEAA